MHEGAIVAGGGDDQGQHGAPPAITSQASVQAWREMPMAAPWARAASLRSSQEVYLRGRSARIAAGTIASRSFHEISRRGPLSLLALIVTAPPAGAGGLAPASAGGGDAATVIPSV